MQESKHTTGPWTLCHHLQSEDHDKSCSCGYRGGIWGADGNAVICEIGATEIPDEPSLPRYPREQELANARLIAAAPEMYDVMKEFCDRVDKGEVRSKKTYAKFKEILNRIDI